MKNNEESELEITMTVMVYEQPGRYKCFCTRVVEEFGQFSVLSDSSEILNKWDRKLAFTNSNSISRELEDPVYVVKKGKPRQTKIKRRIIKPKGEKATVMTHVEYECVIVNDENGLSYLNITPRFYGTNELGLITLFTYIYKDELICTVVPLIGELDPSVLIYDMSWNHVVFPDDSPTPAPDLEPKRTIV